MKIPSLGWPCTDGKTFGLICFEQTEIKITGQSTCVADEEERPCTWYGFTFRYKNASPHTTIVCRWINTSGGAEVNPFETVNELTYSGTFAFSFGPGDGMFFWPQYSILGFSEPGEERHYSSTVCYHNDKKIFAFDRVTVRPVNSEDELIVLDGVFEP